MTQLLSAPPPALTGVSPYRGLEPYSEADWPFFFGRERECEIVTANLMASRLTLLYGASGVGKTSVLRAGVSHHLSDLAREQRAELGAPEHAVVVFSTWRDEPMAALLAHVARAVADALGEPAPAPPASSVPFVDALEALGARLGGQLLIMLDQFEEYFLYHGQEDGPGSFAVEFPRAVNRPGLRANFLIGIREDGLAKLDRFKARLPNLFTNYLRLDCLDRESARSAIEEPIHYYNSVQPRTGSPVSIEPALTEEVLNQVASDTDSATDAVPGGFGADLESGLIDTSYLQVVMTRLWSEEQLAGSATLRFETLQRLGNARDILRTHLDTTMHALPSDLQDAAAEIFHYLVTPSGTKIAHAADDLANYTGIDCNLIETVLRRLSEPQGGRLLRSIPPFGRQREPRYEIRHDRLAEPVLSWRTRHNAERQLEAERERLLVQLDAARSEAQQQLAQQVVEANHRLVRERDLAVTRTRRRLLLPAAWAGLFWLTYLVGWVVAAIFSTATTTAMRLDNATLGMLFLFTGGVLGLPIAGLAVAVEVKHRVRRMRQRQVYAIIGWWMLGAVGGGVAAGIVVLLPVWAISALQSRMQSWLLEHSLPRPPLLTMDVVVWPLVLSSIAFISGFIVQAAIAGRLTLREVDLAGGFDARERSPEVRYAGFWVRMFATVIDSVLIIGVAAPIMHFTGQASASLTYYLVITIIGFLYATFTESSAWQGTVGKKLLGLRVTDQHYQRITFRRASARYFGKWISAILVYIGFLMVAFTSRKQGLHDKIAGTLVLNDGQPFWHKQRRTSGWIQGQQRSTA